MTNPWKETVRDIYDLMHSGKVWGKESLIAMIEENHHDYFCVGHPVDEPEPQEVPKAPMDNRKIIKSQLKTPDGTILTSEHRHDFTTHQDANGKQYMLDGGLDYIRCSANGDEELITLFDDEPHEVQRKVLTWGSYGINGDQPLRRIPIGDMETSHIEAVLRECNPAKVLKNCMMIELSHRQES